MELYQKNYLMGPDTRARLFYLLPKIHTHPDVWTLPREIPRGRPIVSDCGSESYRSADSYLKDTYDFVEKLKTIKLTNSSLFFTINIDSL